MLKICLPKKTRGFTLIEIMVAVAIIAVISAVGLASFSQAQKIGRDARRKQDLRSIAIALEIYYQKNGQYPYSSPNYSGVAVTGCQTSTSWCTSGNGLTLWIPALDSNYINALPKDPQKDSTNPFNGGSNNGYAYYSNGATCGTYSAWQFYTLVAGLENSSDPDRNSAHPFVFCDGSTTTWTNSFVISNK